MKNREEKIPAGLQQCLYDYIDHPGRCTDSAGVDFVLTDNTALIHDGYSFFPKKWSVQAYNYIFVENKQVVRAYGISFLVTAVGTSISLVITTLLAYSISRRAPGPWNHDILCVLHPFVQRRSGSQLYQLCECASHQGHPSGRSSFHSLMLRQRLNVFADEIVFRHKHTGRAS